MRAYADDLPDGPAMLNDLFLSHPHSIGESYFQHQKTALGFALALWAAGLACMIHALVPCLFQTRASRAVAQLHNRMVLHRTTRPASLNAVGPGAKAA